MKRLKPVKQHDESDCGAACLLSILRYYGSDLPISRIRQLAGTDSHGTSLLGLTEAAAQLGLQTKPVRVKVEEISLLSLPAIIHVVMESGLQHYMVLVNVRSKKLCCMDPADGRFHMYDLNDFIKIFKGIAIMLSPAADFSKQKGVTVFHRFLSLMKPYRWSFIQAFIGSLLYTLLGFSTALYVQKLVDDVIDSGNTGMLHIMGYAMAIIILMQVFIGMIRSVIGFRTGQLMDTNLITAYYHHLFRLPLRFFETMRTGEITSRISDAVKIRFLINDISMNIMLNGLIVLFTALIMLLYYWKLALIVFVSFPLYYLLYRYTNYINRKWQRVIMENAAMMEADLVEGLHSASTVKRLYLEAMVIDKNEHSFYRFMKSTYRAGMYNLYTGVMAEWLNKILVVAVLWMGALFVVHRELSTGELLSFYSLIGYFTGPVAALIGSGKSVQDALIAADRLFEVIDLETELGTSIQSVQLNNQNAGDIVFENVFFRYGSNLPILEQISFRAKKGEITAIRGESGSGKSTILSLIQRLYPLSSGTIRIGDIPIEHITLESLRTTVGIIPQQIDLFSGSVIENICIGENAPDMEKIIRLCRLLTIDSFIEKLPQSYFTRLGERGTNLSGGQKQLLAIARALYREPQILIMDEATANLDPQTEQNILQVLLQLKSEGMTILLIAHREAPIKISDRVFHMKELSGIANYSG